MNELTMSGPLESVTVTDHSQCVVERGHDETSRRCGCGPTLGYLILRLGPAIGPVESISRDLLTGLLDWGLANV